MSEINPACCREKGCGMAEKCKSETPQRVVLAEKLGCMLQKYRDDEPTAAGTTLAEMGIMFDGLETALAESRAECERLNKELQAASIDYRGCMLDRAEYLRRMREAEAECERLRFELKMAKEGK